MHKQLQMRILGNDTWNTEKFGFLRGFCLSATEYVATMDKLQAGETVRICDREFRLVPYVVPEGVPVSEHPESGV